MRSVYSFSRLVIATVIPVAAALVGIVAAPAAHAQTFTSTGGPFAIPDANALGVSSTITVAPTFNIASFNSITITGLTHTWVGDLIGTLTHGSVTVDIFDRIAGSGSTGATGVGDSSAFNGDYTFALGGSDINAAATTAGFGVALPSTGVVYAPYLGGGVAGGTPGGSTSNTQTFASFTGLSVAGAWTLNISDRASGDTGSFTGFSFNVTPAATAPEPGSLSLLGMGLVSGAGTLGIVRRRRKAA